jgi:YbbR-like protein.
MKNNVTRRLLYNNKFIFVSSVVVAILFWLFVVINVSPDYKRTIYGAQISIEENSQSLTALGLHVVDKSTDKVSITVTGPRNVIGRLTGSSFSVTPELSMISKAGSYELKLNAVLKSPDNRVRITKIKPRICNSKV